jgi:glycogen debranching enzyme
MTSSWAFDSEPPSNESGVVTLVEQTSFCIGSRNGNIDPGSANGLFFHDTRILSRWVMTIDGTKVQPLTVTTSAPFLATFIGRARSRQGPGSGLLIERSRYVGNGMREDIVIRNLTSDPITTEVRVIADADFADLYEVKESRIRTARHPVVTTNNTSLLLEHEHAGDRRGVRILAHEDGSGTGNGAEWRDATVTFSPKLPGRGIWSVSLEIHPIINDEEISPSYPFDRPVYDAPAALRAREWVERSPRITSPDAGLLRTIATSRRDLGALRLFDPEHPGRVTIAAGAPWFMALFGRDSLFASLMTLPLDPSLALGTLQILARHQGTKVDPWTEEEPGRILHEVRLGAEARLSLGGGSIYYGTADATPLFVMLLGELRRWGLGEQHLDELLPAADRALEWIRTYGNLKGDGFVYYKRTSDHGLVNQGWKDSWNAINFVDGRLPEAPLALCEVQAYTYAAYVARGHLARELGDNRGQQQWAEAAEQLRADFNRRFWIDDRGWYAVALDGNGAQVDSLTSNIGHCLWSGIVDADKAGAVAEHLISPEMFTGWGIRTLATSMGRYNPMSYHNGSVWPHDTAIAVAGLMRYGFIDEAKRIAVGMFDAAEQLGGQLPEVFCGFDRGEFELPIPFPTACAPQAWAAATPMHLLRSLLQLNPSVSQGTICMDPVVPERMLPLRIEKLPIGDAKLSIDVNHYDFGVEDMPEGLTLLRSAVPTS